ncbi:MAG: glycosyl hydrolase family 57 [Methylococcales bacterium]|nr:glycosyl hydrolase family 57 [Methylococcales bacterium]
MPIFTRFLTITCPEQLPKEADGGNPEFEVRFEADGDIPFPQVIVHGDGRQKLINGDAIKAQANSDGACTYHTTVPAGLFQHHRICVQIEGCRSADLSRAQGDDWIKTWRDLTLSAPTQPKRRVSVAANGSVLYFGIHKHMHQPYYRAADPDYWDGEKDDIFGARAGNYTGFVPAAIRQYIDGGLAHAGLSCSWSGTLIEQLDRCAATGRCGGRFAAWRDELRGIAQETTALGHPRLSFSAFGHFHPLMALIPERDIVRQIDWHRKTIRATFGVDASRVLFPPETAFHARMIPALKKAGIEAVIYDSIHRYRACRDYPYAGIGEGMLPPNPAEQVNPPVDDWLQLTGIWAGSKVAPSLMRPEWVGYEDPDGTVHSLIAVPAERYIGNEDARGGFGALQYPDVLGQLHDRLLETGGFDPKQPPFFLLHSDGDNHGGGADSYYHHNTQQLVRWLHEDPRFELTTTEDYLTRFPPDPGRLAHIEPGSWSGADNGDPQFMKWFGGYDRPYSPDLNSWAVLTALQNLVHSVEDALPEHPALPEAMRLLLTAQTSCYWYWTGQGIWDRQVTDAANRAWQLLADAARTLASSRRDLTAPTLFAPWVTPENPGGQRWGQGCLQSAPRAATLHTFIHDLSGTVQAVLVMRGEGGETRLPLVNHGPYPSQTGAKVSADYFTCELPVGAGDIRYYLEAEDQAGHVARGTLERLFLA